MKTRSFMIGWALVVLLVGACPVLAAPILSYDFEGCTNGALLGQDTPAWGYAHSAWGSLTVADVVGADGTTSKAVHRVGCEWGNKSAGNVRDWPTSVSFTSADTAIAQSYQFKPNPDDGIYRGIFGGAKFWHSGSLENYQMTFGMEYSSGANHWYLRNTTGGKTYGAVLATDNWHEVKLVMDFSTAGGLGTLWHRDLETVGAVWTQDSSIVNKPLGIAQNAGEYVVTGLKFWTSEHADAAENPPAGWIDNYKLVPEPATWLLLTMLGMFGLGLRAVAKRR